ncbi:PAS domain S-box protein [Bradyrhizobium hipponense]|uniref:PAS domain S-box protein n=1 Tax=Bradyrhizobium hipponense TaxID=2605638 RepID=UPI0016530394|nr:PAS domain S-box protein [Bradyrhizobium hipponense]
MTEAKARVGRARKTRADLEQELKVSRREIADARERLAEAKMQQRATSEMLRLISNSPIQSVLDTVAENAARLCDANNVEIFRLEDNLLRLAASYGEIPVVIHAYQGVPVNRDTVTGRAACDRRTIHVHDLAAEEGEYPVGSSNAKREGHHTTLGTPLLREGTPVGIILVRRMEVRPFSDQQIALLETFADQAAIAIENARLFNDLQEREARIRRLVDSNIIGIFIGDSRGRIIEANDAFLGMLGYDHDDVTSGRMRWTKLTPTEWVLADEDALAQLSLTGTCRPYEKEYCRKDGSRVPVLVGGAFFERKADEGVVFVIDMSDRKRAEGALREREAKIRRLVDSNIIGIFTTGLEGRVLEANDAFLRLVGHDRDDLLSGRVRWTDLTPPEWHEHDERALRELYSNTVAQPYEKEFFRKDGSRVPVLIGGALFEEGGDEGVAFVLDLTERKRAEQALRESEYRHRQIIDTVPSLLWSAGPDGEPTYVNQRILDYTGTQQEDFKHRGWEAFLHPDDLPETAQDFYRAVQTGTSHEAVHRVRRSDGEYRWHHTRAEPLRDQLGRIVQWHGVSVDIDERKKAEERLRRSETYLAEAQRLSHSGVAAYNVTAILYGSEETYRIWGFDPAQGVPTREAIFQRVHPDDRGALYGEVERAVSEKRDYKAAYRIVLPDGTTKHIEVIGRPAFAASGELVEIVTTQIDVTERKRAEEALRTVEAEARESERRYREAQLELAHANRVATTGQLTASITHEVNQPITAAVTYALAARRFLSAEPPNLRELDDVLSLIVREGNRAGEVVGRIRALIKKAPARKDAVAINDAILEIIALTRAEAANNSVAVRTQLAEGLPPVQGDRVQLQQVLLNLIINAIEAMRDVGEEERELLISTRNEPDSVSVEVRDSGPGFAPETLDRVFEAFYTTKPSGLGLGLSICRSIIEAHNGRLWASHNVPRGAVFRFIAPAHPAASS